MSTSPKDLPLAIIKITYLPVEGCKHARFRYCYTEQEVHEWLSKDWRHGAKAEIFTGTYEKMKTVKADEKKGLWS